MVMHQEAFFLACYLRSYGCLLCLVHVCRSLTGKCRYPSCIHSGGNFGSHTLIIGHELHRTRVVRRVHDCNHEKLRIKSHHSVQQGSYIIFYSKLERSRYRCIVF
ncbi:hypothetical protein R6Q59_033543, partial [Mikania micrantha]